MTISNIFLSPERALIVNDTVASAAIGDRWFPIAFAAKSYAIPHLGLIVSGRNVVAPAHALYFALVTGRIQFTRPEELARTAPFVLYDAWKNTPASTTPEMHADVMVFGYCAEMGRVVGYRFQSQDNFSVLEIMSDGEEVSPQIDAAPYGDDLFALAMAQYERDRLTPYLDRDHIGGDVVTYELTADADGRVTITARQLGRLPGYDEFAAAIAPETITPNLDAFDRCAPWLTAALEYDTGERTIADIRRAYADGHYTLFAGDKSAVLVETIPVADRRAVHPYLIGGELGEVRDSLIPLAETYARRAGCSLSIIMGRKGWARALSGSGYRLVGPCAHPGSWIVGKDLAHV